MKKILIVDDIEENRILLSSIVQRLGYEYDLASDGKDAVDKLECTDYFLIFMDIKMPVMDGVDATKFIRKRMTFPKNRVKVVAVTAHKYRDFFDDYHDVGFNDIISKPYTQEKITNIINYHNIISAY